MQLNHFQLTTKCPFNCLKCSIKKSDNIKSIITKINNSPKRTLNLFFNLTNNNSLLPEIITIIKEKKQKLGLFYNGLSQEEYLKYAPDLILFPMFSTIPENHDSFIGKKSYYNMISFINSLPKEIIKPIVFFVTKDNISETTDLSGILLSLKTQLYLQPLNFYNKDDFNNEMLEYLKRIGRQKNIILLPINNKTAHCKNWTLPKNLFEIISNSLLNLFKNMRKS